MLSLHREFEWVRKPDTVCISGPYTELLICPCAMFSFQGYVGCGVIFCKALFFIFLDFPKKDPLKFYDWISNMVVSRVNIYQLTEGKSKQYIQPLFKNFRKIMNSLILVP